MKKFRRIRSLLIFFLALYSLTRAPSLYASKIIAQPLIGYYASIPQATSQDKALPILVCLPGSGIKAKDDIHHWAFAGNKKGFAVITMDVNYLNENAHVVHDRLLDIIESLSKDYRLNKNKVFIAGTSAGGMMAMALALFYPDKFKAIGVISGARISFGAEKFLKNARQQLFYFYHGKEDKIVPIAEFYSTKNKLEKNKAVVEFKVVPDSGHTLPPNYYRELADLFSQLSDLYP